MGRCNFVSETTGKQRFPEQKSEAGSRGGIFLNELVALLDVFQAELEGGVAAIVVLYYGVADVERVAGLDVVVELGHVEGYGGDLVERLLLVNQSMVSL